MHRLTRFAGFLIVLLANVAVLAAPDIAREKRMADEIVDAILDGDVITLPSGQQDFMGIYTETEQAKGNVLILHGRGFHPDWVSVVQPLRVGLVEHGWNTLSIQMPVLPKNAKYNDYVEIFGDAIPRIEAGLQYLTKSNQQPTVLIAHSCGAHMANHWVHQKGQEAVRQLDGFIGIGMGATDYKQPMVEPFALDKMSIPVLDLYAENDFPAVLRLAPQRAALLQQAGNAKSKQQVVADAEHYFTDRDDELLEAIAAWLGNL